jgi:hypothetical protein
MGRRIKQIILEKRNTTGQQIHEEMLKSLNIKEVKTKMV